MKKYLLGFVINLFLVNSVFAENSTDSLKKEALKSEFSREKYIRLAQAYEYVNTDSAKFYANLLMSKLANNDYDYKGRVNNVLGNINLLENNLDAASEYFENAIDYSEKGEKYYLEGLYKSSLAQIKLNQSKVKESVLLLNESIALMENNDDNTKSITNLATAYGILGDAYLTITLYDKSISNLYKSISLHRQKGDSTNVGISLNSLASVYNNKGEIAKAKDVYFEALHTLEKVDYDIAKGTIYFNLAEIHFKQNNKDSANYYLDFAEKTIAKSGTTYNFQDIFLLKSKVAIQQKNYLLANNLIQKSKEYSKVAGTMTNYYQATITEAEINLSTNLKEKAEQLYKEALSFFKKEKLLKDISETEFCLAQYYIFINQKDSANFYLNQYQKSNNEFLNTEKQTSITAQEIKFETSLKEAKITQQESELKFAKTKNILYLAGGLLSLMIALGFGFLYQRIKKQKQKIQKQKTEILHNNKNSLQQMIIMLENQIGNENSQSNQERLMTLNILNVLLYEKSNDGNIDLATFLNKLVNAKKITTDATIDISFDNNSYIIDNLLMKDIGLIINELTTNSIKYAFRNVENPSILIDIKSSPNKLILNYNDNGIGLPENFDINKERNSFGINFIVDLVKQHHGDIKFSNNIGVHFKIELPVR